MNLMKKIVIVGGGSAGWMAAAALSKSLGHHNHDISLVESEQIGTVGVGEATIPPTITFNNFLGIDEDEFIRATNATIKLGIQFVNWRKLGSSYFHPFGVLGSDMDGIGFLHFWLRWVSQGGKPELGRFNAETLAAEANKFSRTAPIDVSGRPNVHYAYQFDASLYAAFLRNYCEKRGVIRHEGRIVGVDQHPDSGNISALRMENGEQIAGDLFIDCSGFRGLLIEETLHSGYEDWSQWLPCNRAAAVPCEKAEIVNGSSSPGKRYAPTTPYTRSTAQEAGWQWRIPLQHRTGNGYVFCEAFISEEEACETLLSRLDGKPLKDPKILKFVTGHRRKIWNKNVVAIGLASGFLEPLESTSIHLAQVGITKLLTYFPKLGVNDKVCAQYNAEMLAEYVNVKDFLIAHYKVTDREDTEFWRFCKNMEIPDSLSNRLEIFHATAGLAVQTHELFKENSWASVLLGQGLTPRAYHPIADGVSDDQLRLRLSRLRSGVQDKVNALGDHDDFLQKLTLTSALHNA